ncbi:Pol [Symbiodinium sp. CCMP2592]|nr:Pol [Symbiodinium sp. CCMP2592]
MFASCLGLCLLGDLLTDYVKWFGAVTYMVTGDAQALLQNSKSDQQRGEVEATGGADVSPNGLSAQLVTSTAPASHGSVKPTGDANCASWGAEAARPQSGTQAMACFPGTMRGRDDVPQGFSLSESSQDGGGEICGAAGASGPAFGTFGFDSVDSHGGDPTFVQRSPLEGDRGDAGERDDGCTAGLLRGAAFGGFDFGFGPGGSGVSTAADFPLLRGGSKLLAGLRQILEEAGSDDEEEEISKDAWLRTALARLVDRRPKNLLQELKSLIRLAGRRMHAENDEDYCDYDGGWSGQAVTEDYGDYDGGWQVQAALDGWPQQQLHTFSDEWWTGWQQDASGWWFFAGGPGTTSTWARGTCDGWHMDGNGWWAPDGSSWPSSARTVRGSQPASATEAPARTRQVVGIKGSVDGDDGWRTVTRKRRPAANLEQSTWRPQKDVWKAPSGMVYADVPDARTLAQQLDEVSGVAWLLATDDVSEVKEATDLIDGAVKDDDKQSLTIIFLGAQRELTKAQIDFQVMSIPGQESGALRMRKVPVIVSGHTRTLLQLATRDRTPLIVAKPPPSWQQRRATSFVCRCEFDRRFNETAWKTVVAAPAAMVRKWALRNGVAPSGILDAFAPKQIGANRVSVMLRLLDKGSAEALCRTSGAKASNEMGPWFIDVVGDKASQGLKLPPRVQWLDWVPEESWDTYLVSARKQAGSDGVALGAHQLGIRVAPDDPRLLAKPALWRMRGVRQNWCAGDVEDLLKQLGFESITIQQKIRNRSVEWLFKGHRQDNLESLQREVAWDGADDVGEITVVKEARRRNGPASKALHTGRADTFVLPEPTAADLRPQRQRKQERKREAQADKLGKSRHVHLHDECTAKTGKETETTASADAAKPESKKRERSADELGMDVDGTEWLPPGAKPLTNVGEGNCVWHALATHESTPGKLRSHRQLRQWVVNAMKEQSDDLEPLWIALGKRDADGKPSTMDWSAYLAQQGTNGAWSGALELRAYAFAADCRVWVLTDKGRLHLINGDGKRHVALRYQVHGHYELLQGYDETDLWTRAVDLNVKGREELKDIMRGGARALSSFASSRQKTKVRRTLSDFASVKSGTPAPPAGPGAGTQHTDDDEPAKWVCDECKHMPKEAFSQLWTDHSLEIKVEPCPQQLRIWTCSKCHCGIRDERRPEHQVQAAARRHLLECTGHPMTLRANLKRCSEQMLTRQLAGGTSNSRLTNRRIMMDSYARGKGRHQIVEWDKVRLGGHLRTCAAASTPGSEGLALATTAPGQKLSAAEIHSLEAKARKRAPRRMAKAPPLQVRQWLRDLTKEGVEPHPGPLLRGAFLNCGGLQGAFRAVQHLKAAQHSLVVLCETQACAWNHAQLTSRFQQLGYRVWGFSGREGRDTRNRPFVRGGILVAVCGTLTATCMHTHNSPRGDLVAMDFSTLQASFFWQRGAADNEGGLTEQLLELQRLAASREVPWLALGDWNLQPQENTLRDALSLQLCAPSDDTGRLCPSRFSSARCIDYGLLTAGLQLHASHDVAPLSDHRVLYFEGRLPTVRQNASFLKPTASLQRPPEVTTAAWHKAVKVAASCEEWPVPTGAPDEEWQDFCAAAEGALSAAAKSCGRPVHSVGCRPKGSLPETLSAGEVVRSPDKEVPYKVRQYTKLLGRIYEAVRQQDRGSPALWRNLRRTWPGEWGVFPADLTTAANLVQTRLQQEREAHTRSRLAQWRRRMAQGGKAATQWLKRQVACAPTTLRQLQADGQTHRTCSVAETFDAMRTFWRRIWHRRDVPEELQRLREGRLSRPAGEAMRGDWRLEASAFQHGSAGPDGWAPSELEAFDEEVWECFLRLWHDWCERDLFPQSFRHCRQVMLPKEELDAQGAVDVENMRPICVQPVVCRVISSVMACRSQEWLLAKVNADTHGSLKGRSVEAAVLALDEAFSTDGILVSLDMRKCFDFMSPELCLGILLHEGMHPNWARHLAHIWQQQRRWLQVQRWVAETPEDVSNSVPQGCAMAPLALVCLLLEATRDVPSQVVGRFRQSIYMDDRAFAASSPQGAVQAWRSWTAWCERLGLRENLSKAKVICRNPFQQATMVQLGIPPRCFVDSARVLGVDFSKSSAAGRLSDTATQRDEEAKRILDRLACLPVPHAAKVALFRTRVSPLTSWGLWLQARNTQQDSKFTTRVKKVVGGVTTMASRHLWQLLEGHWTCPSFTASMSAAAAFIRAKAYWRRMGQTVRGGLWARRVAGIFEGLGFVPTRRDAWRLPGHPELQLWGQDTKAVVQRCCHALREAFRRQLLQSFLDRNRRDARALRRQVRYSEQQVKGAIRLYGQCDGHQRAVMIGAALSDAVYDVMDGGAASQSCPWCGRAVLPCWSHLLWHCPHFARGRPPRPQDPMAQRLAWPMTAVTAHARAVVIFAGGIRKAVLNRRLQQNRM